MGNPEYDILKIFQREPYRELSTTELSSIVQKEQFECIQEILKDKYSSRDSIKQAKSQKKKLHRQLLYHLNKLVESGLLKVSKISPKGQKYFILGIENGKKIIIDGNVRTDQEISISKPKLPLFPIGDYEKQDIVAKYGKDWLSKVDSIFLEANMFDNNREITEMVDICFPNINDCICLNNFETLVSKHDIEDVVRFLKKINSKCIDFDKVACCSVTVKNIINNDKFLEVLKQYLKLDDIRTLLVFNMSKEDIKTSLFENIIEMISASTKELYIKNNEVSTVPYFIGKVGPYTIDEKDWKHYKNEFKDKLYGFVLAQATLFLDITKLFEKKKRNLESFENIVKKLMFTFNESNDVQRMQSRHLFPELFKLDKEKGDFLIFSRNLIRLWNYGWKSPNFDQDFLSEYMESGYKMVKDFSRYQEIVYKCCGMPTRIKISLSSAHKDAVQSFMTKSNFLKFKVRNITDLQNNKATLAVKEKLFELMDGGDIMSFYKIGIIDTAALKNEIQYIFNHFKLPFFKYNFGETKDKNITLDKFM
ncbi:MAG: hypothetical protein KAT43_02080 [Nanoarchaeota archaeon]|nr:hypothetical protein [Nanoarchaeota archaeon]